MNLNWAKMTAAERKDLLEKARLHLRFVCRLYQIQHDGGRYYLHEHPVGATSWKEPCIKVLQKNTNPKLLVVDQCAYGLEVHDEEGNLKPARKTTTLMTNCPAMALTLNRRCTKDHKHVQLVGGHRCKEAQTYPRGLCDAIVTGVKLQQKWDELGRYLIANLDTDQPQEAQRDVEMTVPPEEDFTKVLIEAWDDISGKQLDPRRVSEARRLEMEYYKRRGVFVQVPVKECYEATGKSPLKTR